MGARSFVAMGDSFTEGLDDLYPDGCTYRGWADLVAAHLAAAAARADAAARTDAAEAARADGAGGGAFRYANLAIRGRLFDAVVAEQVPVALEMRPDVLSFAAGGNDVLRRGCDVGVLLARYDAVVGRLRATGAEVVLFRFIDLSRRLPGRRILRPRIDALNDGVVATASRYGAHAIDLWTDPDFDHPAMWSADRLHLSGVGHRRVAAHVLTALGVDPDPGWLAAPPASVPLGWAAARGADVRWARDHLAPWVRRRLTGRSTGDARTAKRPALAPVEH